MYKTTREFIAARQPHSERKVYLLQGVDKVGGGEPNSCFQNAYRINQESKGTANEIACISGWLVMPYDAKNKCAAIIQHWWNCDSRGRHFDTSPHLNESQEYVFDFDIYESCRKNSELIRSNVGYSLMYQDGKFFLLKNERQMLFEEISDLRTELLLKYF